MRGATNRRVYISSKNRISIHAPLAGCDINRPFPFIPRQNFNPRTPCGVRPDRSYRSFYLYTISIHAPLAGCDNNITSRNRKQKNFNPRTPCGVRPKCWSACVPSNIFQSTHPLRGATERFASTFLSENISIHAPLAGCDRDTLSFPTILSYFNPRTPCGVRPVKGIGGRTGAAFQSTHPLRGATIGLASLFTCVLFQSTHPLRGATFQKIILYSLNGFQSTHPLRGATAKLPKYSRQICAKATKFLQSRTKSGVATCWAKGKRLLFPTLRGANLPGKTGTLPVRIR